MYEFNAKSENIMNDKSTVVICTVCLVLFLSFNTYIALNVFFFLEWMSWLDGFIFAALFFVLFCQTDLRQWVN